MSRHRAARNAERFAREALGKDHLSDTLSDAVRSDERLIHLASAVHNLRMADKTGETRHRGDDEPDLASAEWHTEAIAERRVMQVAREALAEPPVEGGERA